MFVEAAPNRGATGHATSDVRCGSDAATLMMSAVVRPVPINSTVCERLNLRSTCPRIGDVRRMRQHIPRHWQRCGLGIAEREHDVVRGETSPVLQLDSQWQMPLDTTQVDDRAVDDFETNISRCTQLRGQQHLVQVFAIQRTRQEVFASDLRNAPLRELQEFPGRSRARRHTAGRHVEQIRKATLGVSGATRHLVRTLDQDRAASRPAADVATDSQPPPCR